MVGVGVRPGWFRAGPYGYSGQRCLFQECGALVELEKWEPYKYPHFFELVMNFPTVLLQLMPKGDVTFCNLSDVTSERFGYYAEMTFDLFHLLSVHGSLVQTDLFTNATGVSGSTIEWLHLRRTDRTSAVTAY